MTGKDGSLNSLAAAGKDREFVWADAVIEGDSVVVSANDVPNPMAVRYAWAANPSHRNLLHNQEGIPASPFRTDDWPLFDAENYVPAEQIKPRQPADYRPVPLKRSPMTQ